ncbi:GtrA family protein [Diaphorobacter aerolatus]|uniref:GtrA family protein n=1 Tax=Diaphorobacter aerolatus TaxID=1288495 RepID=A0A7H0GNK7_9BURK|nr:GtrA family protein [Diaphorobacter aerolatus]QNP49873.1 GtrA family protein [Diaphorobacter aerolatus]
MTGQHKQNGEKGYLVRYISAGMVNAVIGIGAIAILTAMKVDPIVSNIVGFGVGMVSSFTLSKYFVFKKKTDTKKQVFRYGICFAIAYSLNLAVLVISKGLVHDLLAQMLAIACYVIAMYLMMRFYIFQTTS